MVKVVVFGAGGIIGQHMMKQGYDAIYVRKTPGTPWVGLDMEDYSALQAFLRQEKPDCIINLAGQSVVDQVEQNPIASEAINIDVPVHLATWAHVNGSKYIHVSTQGVFSGENAPYLSTDTPHPITEYGKQKAETERLLLHTNCVLARMTFVIGVRPFPKIGRANPLEQMFASDTLQVNDKFFSPVFAKDAAIQLWDLVENGMNGTVYNLGIPETYCRAEIAKLAGKFSGNDVEEVSHDHWPGIAPRPHDTTWATGSRYSIEMEQGMSESWKEWLAIKVFDPNKRAQAISDYLGFPLETTKIRLDAGFHHNHALVASDFNEASPQNYDELLAWYRTTDSYVWELSAYHLNEGFNYIGMCYGIATHLLNAKVNSFLALGDGIGDLSLTAASYGLNTTYHDLEGGVTAGFAQYLFKEAGLDVSTCLTSGWEPDFQGKKFDSIVALDFFEHLTDVEGWIVACYNSLNDGGLFLAQNAFAIGDAEHGNSIPMHLSENNRWEHDWDPYLSNLGMTALPGGWWKK